MEIRKGLCGNTPRIGDTIAFNPPKYKGLMLAVIESFSDSGLPRVKLPGTVSRYNFGLNSDGTYSPKTGFVLVNVSG